MVVQYQQSTKEKQSAYWGAEEACFSEKGTLIYELWNQ